MSKSLQQMTDLQLVIVLYGIIKYPVEFREQCENEIKRRTKAEGRQNLINAPLIKRGQTAKTKVGK